jgi:hypothetical protein
MVVHHVGDDRALAERARNVGDGGGALYNWCGAVVRLRALCAVDNEERNCVCNIL